MSKEVAGELRLHMQKFIRLFVTIEKNVTPCGYPLSTSQVFALQEIENRTIPIHELAQQLSLERSSVSRLVDGLVKEDLVHRVINESNRREMLISLTEKGARTIQQVKNQSLLFYKEVLNELTIEEQSLVVEGFKKFTTALQNVKEGEKLDNK